MYLYEQTDPLQLYYVTLTALESDKQRKVNAYSKLTFEEPAPTDTHYLQNKS